MLKCACQLLACSCNSCFSPGGFRSKGWCHFYYMFACVILVFSTLLFFRTWPGPDLNLSEHSGQRTVQDKGIRLKAYKIPADGRHVFYVSDESHPRFWFLTIVKPHSSSFLFFVEQLRSLWAVQHKWSFYGSRAVIPRKWCIYRFLCIDGWSVLALFICFLEGSKRQCNVFFKM